jgi:hypothetical protein
VRGCLLENAEAIIESIVIRHSEKSARDSSGIMWVTAPATTYAALRAATRKQIRLGCIVSSSRLSEPHGAKAYIQWTLADKILVRRSPS